MPDGEYDQKNLYIGLPAIVGLEGVRKILQLNLTEEEKEKLNNSCDVIGKLCREVKL